MHRAPEKSWIPFFCLLCPILAVAAPTVAAQAEAGKLKPLVRIFDEMGDPRAALNPELFQKDSDLWFDHNAGYMVPKKMYYDAHPEYYALRLNGRRIPKTTSDAYIHLCMSNPDVQRIATERVLGWIRLPKVTATAMRPGMGGAFGTGLLLSLIIGPCGTPVLASVLSFAAYQQSFLYGGLLLFVYALGHSALVLVAGTSMGAAKRLIESRGLRRTNLILQRAAGALIIVVGIYFVAAM